MDRKRRLTLATGLTMLLMVVFAALLTGRPGAIATRGRGELTQAVLNTEHNSGTPHTRIATDAAHKAVISETGVTYYDQSGTEYRTDIASTFEITQLFDQHGYSNFVEDGSAPASAVLGATLPILIFVVVGGLLFRQMRRGGIMGGVGKSRARTINPGEMTEITFADVAGADEAVLELSEVVNILKHPERYAELGARIPRGVLLVGPPGTGKTLLAKAVAGEAGVPFFSVSGSEFVEMFVGVGASRIRDLFAEARKRGSAIIFIDEIDAVGRRRGGGTGGNSNDEREQTLNQLLVEMDGFDTTTPVIVMAATNRGDVLDPALLRPGRFDRRVEVANPDIIGRTAILTVHARGKPLSVDVDLGVIARQTPGFSGAELANVINEAALLTARGRRKTIEMADVEEACLRVQAGPERANKLLSSAELRLIAHHEMGHALVGHTLTHSDPVHRISIVSRGRALGWTMQLPERDQVLASRAQMTDRLAGLLGGRVAEEIVFGTDMITSGAADDIERATQLSYRMVTELGMSPLGLRAFLPAEPGSPRTYSEELAAAIDVEVDRLLEEAERRARSVLTGRRAALDALAGRLLEVETMDAAEMRRILEEHPVPLFMGTQIAPRRRNHFPVDGPPPLGARSGPGDPRNRPARVDREAVAAAIGQPVQDAGSVLPRRRMGWRRTVATFIHATRSHRTGA